MPDVTPKDEKYSAWADAVGHAIIKSVGVQIGGVCVYCHEEGCLGRTYDGKKKEWSPCRRISKGSL
jgi:cytochrome c5